jgi:hypothetical protein
MLGAPRKIDPRREKEVAKSPVRWRGRQRWMHKLRAVKMRVSYWRDLPCRLLRAVPEHDRRGLLRLRLAAHRVARSTTSSPATSSGPSVKPSPSLPTEAATTPSPIPTARRTHPALRRPSLTKADLADLRRLRRRQQERARRHRVIRVLCHKARALKVRIRFRLGLPSLVPDVPKDDSEGLASLRFALAAMCRESPTPVQEPAGPETSGSRSKAWHPHARDAATQGDHR